MCSLSAGRYFPHSGQVYVAGFLFCARRRFHHLASGSWRWAMGDRIACCRGQPLSSPGVDQQQTKVVVETERYRVTGMLRLPPEGYRSRLSDYLNDPERAFLSLTDVELVPLDGDGPKQQLPFVALSVAHAVLVTHADDGPA
jgi:hypothetical protein